MPNKLSCVLASAVSRGGPGLSQPFLEAGREKGQLVGFGERGCDPVLFTQLRTAVSGTPSWGMSTAII